MYQPLDQNLYQTIEDMCWDRSIKLVSIDMWLTCHFNEIINIACAKQLLDLIQLLFSYPSLYFKHILD